jgi:hypothetical protein
MKSRYRLIRRGVRGGVFYCVDTKTGKRNSLQTGSKDEARQVIEAKNQAERQPFINLQIARAYLTASDPAMASRTWQAVMEEIPKTKQGENQARWLMAIRDKSFKNIRQQPVLGTTAEQFIRVLEIGTIATNVFLRRIHNFALDMNWLPCPIIPKRRWPAVHYKSKRAVTREEHERILEREKNPEINAFYQLCWHLGGSQSDMATLTAEDNR